MFNFHRTAAADNRRAGNLAVHAVSSRVCRYYGSSPAFLCSSATIANPVELAEEITGRKFVRIDNDGSPAAERSYLVISSTKILGHDKKAYGQVSAAAVTAELLPEKPWDTWG